MAPPTAPAAAPGRIPAPPVKIPPATPPPNTPAHHDE